MKCPSCQQEMQVKKKDVSNNNEQRQKYKEYQRVIFWCEKDDIWISVETPITPVQNLA